MSGVKLAGALLDKPVVHYVEIVKDDTDAVVRRIKCGSERSAERTERGVNINLNHNEYHTRIVEDLDDGK